MRHPFVLTPATKSLGLYYDSRIRMYHERHLAIVHNLVHGEGQPYLRLRVRRDFLIEDALIEVSQADSRGIKLSQVIDGRG